MTASQQLQSDLQPEYVRGGGSVLQQVDHVLGRRGGRPAVLLVPEGQRGRQAVEVGVAHRISERHPE